MGYIKDGNDSGSEGSEGSEGKEDAAKMAGLASLGLSTRPLRGPLVKRQFVKVVLGGALELNEADRGASNSFWDEVHSFGMLDSINTTTEGEVTVVVSVIDEKEAKDIISKEPNVVAGKLKISSVSALT